jgi:hypothetical protein
MRRELRNEKYPFNCTDFASLNLRIYSKAIDILKDIEPGGMLTPGPTQDRWNAVLDQLNHARVTLDVKTSWVGGSAEPYAAFCGNWSEYHGDYTWVPLAGGHRTVEDALAALECVREMVVKSTKS